MFEIQFDTSAPIYAQIIDEVKKALARGELMPGDKLPSQRELAIMLKVNANTIQRAYREMEQSGLAQTLRGQGTYVNKESTLIHGIREEMVERIVDNFLKEMISLGCNSDFIKDKIEQKLTMGVFE